MERAWNKIKLQYSDATLDDAKDCYIMLLLDKKLYPINGQGKIKLMRNKKKQVRKIIHLNKLILCPTQY